MVFLIAGVSFNETVVFYSWSLGKLVFLLE